MERYVVTQEHEELWWVSHQDAKLYCYPTEEEARLAALALARDAMQGGAQATVLVALIDRGENARHADAAKVQRHVAS